MFYVFENTNYLQMKGLNDTTIIQKIIYCSNKPKVVQVASQKLCITVQGNISFNLVCFTMLNELMSELRHNLESVHANSIG